MKNRINVSDVSGEGLSLNAFLISQMYVEATVISFDDHYTSMEKMCSVAS